MPQRDLLRSQSTIGRLHRGDPVNLRTIGAWTTAGVALWASLGTLDVAGGPSRRRTHCHAARPRFARGGHRPVARARPAAGSTHADGTGVPEVRGAESGRPHGTADSFLPLYALVVLDPPLSALAAGLDAGAPRVCRPRQAAGVADRREPGGLGDSRRGTRPPPGRAAARLVAAAGFLVLFATSVVFFVASTLALRASGFFPFGDEPHYLVATQSLVKDRDLQCRNNHAQPRLRSVPGRRPGAVARRRAARRAEVTRRCRSGCPCSRRRRLPPLGYRGVTLLMIALASAAAALAWSWVRRVTGSVSAASLRVVRRRRWPCRSWPAAEPCIRRSPRRWPCSSPSRPAPGTRASPTGVDTRSERPVPAWRALLVGLATGALPWLDRAFVPLSLALLGDRHLAAGPRPRAVDQTEAPESRAGGRCLRGERRRLARLLCGGRGVAVAMGAGGRGTRRGARAGRPDDGHPGPAAATRNTACCRTRRPSRSASLGLASMWRAGGRARGMAAELGLRLAALVVTMGASRTSGGAATRCPGAYASRRAAAAPCRSPGNSARRRRAPSAAPPSGCCCWSGWRSAWPVCSRTTAACWGSSATASRTS